MTKTQAISLMIIEKKNAGMNIQEAIDSVLGEGTSKEIISELYDALRAKAQS